MSECLLFGGQATASPRLFISHGYCRGLKDRWRQICGGHCAFRGLKSRSLVLTTWGGVEMCPGPFSYKRGGSESLSWYSLGFVLLYTNTF